MLLSALACRDFMPRPAPPCPALPRPTPFHLLQPGMLLYVQASTVASIMPSCSRHQRDAQDTKTQDSMHGKQGRKSKTGYKKQNKQEELAEEEDKKEEAEGTCFARFSHSFLLKLNTIKGS